MFRQFLETFFFQIMIGLALIAFLGVFVYAYSIEGSNPPPKDVKAQFQTSLGKPFEKGDTDLSSQNLSSKEVSDHFSLIIAEALSFTPSNYEKNVAAVSVYFTPYAYQQYKSYLDNSNLYNVLKAGNLQSGAYSEIAPLELNSEASNGIFKWLFDAPVTISFTPLQTARYGKKQAVPPGQRFTLRAQFTRVKDPADPGKILIENWEIGSARR